MYLLGLGLKLQLGQSLFRLMQEPSLRKAKVMLKILQLQEEIQSKENTIS